MPCRAAVAAVGAVRGNALTADVGGKQAGGAAQGGMWLLVYLPAPALGSGPEAGLNPHWFMLRC